MWLFLQIYVVFNEKLSLTHLFSKLHYPILQKIQFFKKSHLGIVAEAVKFFQEKIFHLLYIFSSKILKIDWNIILYIQITNQTLYSTSGTCSMNVNDASHPLSLRWKYFKDVEFSVWIILNNMNNSKTYEILCIIKIFIIMIHLLYHILPWKQMPL